MVPFSNCSFEHSGQLPHLHRPLQRGDADIVSCSHRLHRRRRPRTGSVTRSGGLWAPDPTALWSFATGPRPRVEPEPVPGQQRLSLPLRFSGSERVLKFVFRSGQSQSEPSFWFGRRESFSERCRSHWERKLIESVVQTYGLNLWSSISPWLRHFSHFKTNIFVIVSSSSIIKVIKRCAPINWKMKT